MLIDSHCHLHDSEFFTPEQAEDCIKRAHKAGVDKIICIGTDPDDSLAARDFANRYENVYWTYGIHPEETSSESYSAFSSAGLHHEETSNRQLEYDFLRDGSLAPVFTGRAPSLSAAASENPQKVYSQLPVAIGEVGLDYHYEGYNRKAQIRLFEQMLQLAVDNDLPVAFHVREAFSDFFPVVANFPGVRGVVHSFTDSKKVLKQILNETAFYIGVNGLATYSTLPLPPLERILLETDAPFLAPVPHRGDTNEPAYIADIAKWLSNKLELPLKEIEKTTTKNVEDLFNL